MSDLTLSVYMPIYNAERFVRAAVQSILSQSFRDFEFVIVDDGSTDQTPQILMDLAGQDSRIRLFTRPNSGVAATANFAIAQAQGKFLARMDGDDISLPNRLQRQVDYLREHPDCVAVGSKMLLIDEEGLPLFQLSQTVTGHEQIDASLMRGGWAIAQPSCMYRREAVNAVGGYRRELSLHEDHDLFLRLAERGKLENIPEVLVHYRKYPGSLTYVESSTSGKVMPTIVREALKRRGLGDSQAPPLLSKPKVPELLDRYREWAWVSLQEGHTRTARKYARVSLRLAPLSPQSWKLLYCVLRGR